MKSAVTLKHDVVKLFCLCGIERVIGSGIGIIIY